jgi:hypothetical protein
MNLYFLLPRFVRLIQISFLLLLVHTANGQTLPRNPDYSKLVAPRLNTGSPLLFHFNFGWHQPVASMAKRFGRDASIGGGFERMTESNRIFGLEGHFFFSQNVKEDPLVRIRTPEGYIIGANQELATVVLRQRGFYMGAMAGRLFVFDENKRSGLRVTASAGWLQHKIRVQDDTANAVQFDGEYIKGYDRLTGGIALQQFIGWQYLGPTRRINWYAGIELNEGITNTRRDWDFAERRKLDETRFDMRIGFRVGWTLAFYPKGADQIEY